MPRPLVQHAPSKTMACPRLLDTDAPPLLSPNSTGRSGLDTKLQVQEDGLGQLQMLFIQLFMREGQAHKSYSLQFEACGYFIQQNSIQLTTNTALH